MDSVPFDNYESPEEAAWPDEVRGHAELDVTSQHVVRKVLGMQSVVGGRG